MSYFFFQSQDPLGIFQSQLSFSATTLRAEYYQISLLGGMRDYRLAQTLDFGFMLVYGILIFAICVKWARLIEAKVEDSGSWAKMGYIAAVMGILAAGCDVVENIFILKMISTQPSSFDFPNNWALIHSSFALIKWILLIISIGWYVTIRIKFRNKI